LNTDEVVGTATTYTGYQGIEVADVYGIYSLQFNNNSLLLKSGSKTVSKTLPSYGNYKNWLFSSSTGATTEGWTTGEFVSSMIGSTESSSDGLSNPYTKYLLRVEPATFGNTKIEAMNINTEVDQKAVIKVRLKIPPADSYGFEDAHLKAYWTYEGGSFSNYASEPIVTSDGYVDYVIKPTWKGTIGSLMLEFDNIPEGSRRPLYYYIDYMYSSPVWNNKKIDDVLQNTINLFVQNGLYGSETKIYGINKKNSGLMKVGKWINVFDVVKKNIFDANKAKYEDDFYKANQIEKINNLGSLHNIITKSNIISMIASKDTKNVLLNFIKEYNEIQTKNYNIDRNMMSTFGISPKKHTDMFDIDAFKNVLSTKYMNLFNIANFYSDNIKSLASIVNFIDEKS
jgi:hypothetical protein